MLTPLFTLACMTEVREPFAEQGGMCNALMDGPPRRCSGLNCVTVRCVSEMYYCPESTVEVGNPVTLSYPDFRALKRQCDEEGGRWEDATTCECSSEDTGDAVFVTCMRKDPDE